MSNITIDIGDGLKFNGNKLMTDWENNGNIGIQSDGIMIPDLSGPPGIGGGSTVDNWTVQASGTGIKANRNVVQLIFTMSCWKVTNHTKSNYQVDNSTMKTKADVMTEMNDALDDYDYTSYNMMPGDMFMFRSKAVPIEYSWWTHTIDDGNRYTWAPCLAIFSVESVTRSGRKITDITLRCLWHDDSVLPGLTNGQILN